MQPRKRLDSEIDRESSPLSFFFPERGEIKMERILINIRPVKANLS